MLWRHKPDGAASPAMMLALGGLAAAGVIVGATHLMLLMAGLIVLLRAGWSPGERRVATIWVALGAQPLLLMVVTTLFADEITRTEAAVAGTILQFLSPSATWWGSRLRTVSGPGIDVLMSCSSIENLSLVAVLFVALLALDGGRWSARATVGLATVSLAVAGLNTVRLILLARSLEDYAWWHNGPGASIYGVVATATAVAGCSLAARWATRA